MSSHRRDNHTPQTLRQVKAAYRKSNGTTRLSEQEIRVIRRRAELDERAAQCREREKRRLQSKKKREEKAQLERLERSTRPKRAGSATIGGEVINQEKEPNDIWGMILGRKRMCKELEAENAGEEDGEKEPATKTIKSARNHDGFSNSNQPSGKENIPPNKPGGICSPQKTPNTLRSLRADKSHNLLTPQHSNIVSPKRHPAAKKVSIKAFDNEVELLDDWQDAFASNSQLERELSCSTQGQQVTINTPVRRNAKTATHNPAHPVPELALAKQTCSKQQQQVGDFIPVTTITDTAAHRNTPLVQRLAPAEPTNEIHPSLCPSVRKQDEEEEDSYSIPPISTQDLEFTSQDLEEIGGRDSLRCNGKASKIETTVATRRETSSGDGIHSLGDLNHEVTEDRDKVVVVGSSSSGGGSNDGCDQVCEAAPRCHAGSSGSSRREGRRAKTEQIDDGSSVITTAAPPRPTVRKAVQDKVDSRDTVQPVNGRSQEAIKPIFTPRITNGITVAHHASHSSQQQQQQQQHNDDLYRIMGVVGPPLPHYHDDEFDAPSDIDNALLQAALDDEFYAALDDDYSAI